MTLIAVVATAAACVDVVIVVAVVGVIEFHWLVVQEVPYDDGVIMGTTDYLEFVELETEYAAGVLYEGLNAKRGG